MSPVLQSSSRKRNSNPSSRQKQKLKTERYLNLICDGYAGQNKNSMFIAMLNSWLLTKAPDHIRDIEVVYPIIGHSFLLPDWVFGNIERKLRRMEMISNPEEVLDIIRQHATVN